MARPFPTITYLRETQTSAHPNAKVVDAQFVVISQPRPLLRKLKRTLFIAAIVAVIGLLIPPIWVLAAQLMRD